MKAAINRRIKLANASFDDLKGFLPECYRDDHIVTQLQHHFPIMESDVLDNNGYYSYTILSCFGDAIARCTRFDRVYRFITWL